VLSPCPGSQEGTAAETALHKIFQVAQNWKVGAQIELDLAASLLDGESRV
jgi:hypothetical protein